ncbi:MAG: monooxygenase [Rhodobiaceae bacterium]|nr:MAG: monooxygenase [Rhodobiaceae bacterium]
MAETNVTDPLEFNADELRAKYRSERDKRLRADGNDQYVETAGDFSHYRDDPYVEPGFTRAPLTDDTDVVIIGGGFGGLLAGARLRDAGVENIRIVEKGGDFGGTWYWNRYPGAACDIESYVYLPLLEETGYMPSKKYATGPEILAYSQQIARHYNLYDNACLQTEIQRLHWDDAASRWVIETSRNDRMTARYVILSNGPLNRPKLPGIPGVETFKGHTFHTSRWDYDYTGGDSSGGLTGLKGKRIGIIGTGATAVQCVSHLAEHAEELFVFQRTPSSIDVRNDRPTDEDWAKSLKPGWHKERLENFNTLVSGGYADKDLVNDGWTEIIRNLLFFAKQDSNGDLTPAKIAELAELADFKKMEQIRGRVDDVIADAATAEALKPWYRQFCKRPCFHDDYLAAFNRENVTLVDTAGQGVERITENAVIANGQAYELDCLVYGTGFEVGTDYTRRAGYDLEGREGVTLSSSWSQGMRTLHGMHVRGFPNAFIMGPAQAGFTANYPHLLDEQARHLAYLLTQAKDRQMARIEVTEEAEQGWVDTILSKATLRQKFFEECTPGYYNNEGKANERAIQNSPYGGGSDEYFRILADWRNEGGLAGLQLSNS